MFGHVMSKTALKLHLSEIYKQYKQSTKEVDAVSAEEFKNLLK
jgi:hypothetical protein